MLASFTLVTALILAAPTAPTTTESPTAAPTTTTTPTTAAPTTTTADPWDPFARRPFSLEPELRVGARALPLVAGDDPKGFRLGLEVAPGARIAEIMQLELGVSATVPVESLSAVRVSLTPAAGFDVGFFYMRVGFPLSWQLLPSSDGELRFGHRTSLGVRFLDNFQVGLSDEADFVDDFVAIGVEVGGTFSFGRVR